MSDFRFAGRWLTDRRVMTLSGDDFKAFVTAGTYMVENRTDGHLTPDDLEFIPRFNRASIPRLIDAGVWIAEGEGWVMVEYQRTQTSRAEFEVLENARRADREKKARMRAAKKGSPGDGPGDMSRGTTQARTGQARQGQDEGEAWYDERDVNPATGEVLDPPQPVAEWWTAPIPDAPTAPANTCRVCSQPTTKLDAWGLCSKVSAPHVEARKQPVRSAA